MTGKPGPDPSNNSTGRGSIDPRPVLLSLPIAAGQAPGETESSSASRPPLSTPTVILGPSATPAAMNFPALPQPPTKTCLRTITKRANRTSTHPGSRTPHRIPCPDSGSHPGTTPHTRIRHRQRAITPKPANRSRPPSIRPYPNRLQIVVAGGKSCKLTVAGEAKWNGRHQRLGRMSADESRMCFGRRFNLYCPHLHASIRGVRASIAPAWTIASCSMGSSSIYVSGVTEIGR